MVGKGSLIHLDSRHFAGYHFDKYGGKLASKMQAIMFIVLNLIDAYLTKNALAMGAVEFNPLMASIGGSIIAKGLMAMAMVLILHFFEKERVLLPLNFLFFCIILWNLAIYAIATSAKLDYFIAGLQVLG